MCLKNASAVGFVVLPRSLFLHFSFFLLLFSFFFFFPFPPFAAMGDDDDGNDALKEMEYLARKLDDLLAEATKASPRLQCTACGRAPERLKMCGGTCEGAAKYCNANCAADHWPVHKRSCRRKPPPPADAAPNDGLDRKKRRELLNAAATAVTAGKVKLLKSLLDQGAPVSQRFNRSHDWGGATLLHVCCMYGFQMPQARLACLRLVAASPGADLNVRFGDPLAPPGIDNTAETPLHMAAIYLPVAIPELLRLGARADLVTWQGQTAADLVASCKYASQAEKVRYQAELEEARARWQSGEAGQRAQQLREEGNAAFRADDLDEALLKYTASLEACVDARTMANMAAAHMRRALAMMRSAAPPLALENHEPHEALAACKRQARASWMDARHFADVATKMAPTCPKGHYRLVRAHAGLRDFPRAMSAARAGLSKCPGDPSLTKCAADLAALRVREDGVLSNMMNPACARIRALMDGPNKPASIMCVYCESPLPEPWRQWGDTCPFCASNPVQVLPPGALDAFLLA